MRELTWNEWMNLLSSVRIAAIRVPTYMFKQIEFHENK